MFCRPAISSHSLGRAWVHDIVTKLDEVARIGFDIELFYEDLLLLAQTFDGEDIQDCQLEAAHQIRTLCDERKIEIVCLQPFMHYEGLRDRRKHVERKEEMRFWVKLAKILRTSIIAIPSTFLPSEQVSGDINLIVSDLAELADLVEPHDIQLAYESLAWGTHVDTWEQTWDIVKRVDRQNFGVCLDTFNIAARIYADPSHPSQRIQNADFELRKSLERLSSTLDVNKIVYVQVADAEYLDQPLIKGHKLFNPAHAHARMSWSRSCRLFYGEQERGGFLPISDILQVIFGDLGFRGWVSAEIFNSSLTAPESTVPADHARRAIQSWEKIKKEFPIQVDHRGSKNPQRTNQLTPQLARSQL